MKNVNLSLFLHPREIKLNKRGASPTESTNK